ncbi:hypothetical protein CASFOL_035180 [Castilleja foliolosa]|uniref:Uncharacterized protein n=1 Tax=Castilleja foliolosa TaxID=1961234 RepID=A0ABD3BSR9_9LAMI
MDFSHSHLILLYDFFLLPRFLHQPTSQKSSSLQIPYQSVTSHVVGYPLMAPKGELKFALESFWDGYSNSEELHKIGFDLRVLLF